MNVDEIGEKLFGRSLRLLLALWILENGFDSSFYQGEAASGVGYTQSGVSTELERLGALGMLQRAPMTGGERRVYYQTLDSPLWKVFESARDALTSLDSESATSPRVTE